MGPGIYPGIDAAVYFGDPFERPTGNDWPVWGSLNQTLAKALVNDRDPPAVVRQRHPRLRTAEGAVRYETKGLAGLDVGVKEIGKAIDTWFFGGREAYEHQFAVCDRSKRAGKDAAREAEDAGKIVLAPGEGRDVERVVTALNSQLCNRWGEGWRRSVQTQVGLLWFEGGCPSRGLADMIDFERRVVRDLKTISSVSNHVILAEVRRWGYELQAGAYTSALDQLAPGPTPWRFEWVFVEKSKPFTMRPVPPETVEQHGCPPERDALRFGRSQWLSACALWERCLRTGVFEGYGPLVVPATRGQVERQRELEVELAAGRVAEIDFDEDC